MMMAGGSVASAHSGGMMMAGSAVAGGAQSDADVMFQIKEEIKQELMLIERAMIAEYEKRQREEKQATDALVEVRSLGPRVHTVSPFHGCVQIFLGRCVRCEWEQGRSTQLRGSNSGVGCLMRRGSPPLRLFARRLFGHMFTLDWCSLQASASEGVFCPICQT